MKGLQTLAVLKRLFLAAGSDEIEALVRARIDRQLYQAHAGFFTNWLTERAWICGCNPAADISRSSIQSCSGLSKAKTHRATA